jgi:hypothetical protein
MKNRTLRLSKETLRNLTQREVNAVQGGTTETCYSCDYSCDGSCPTYQYESCGGVSLCYGCGGGNSDGTCDPCYATGSRACTLWCC